MARRQHRLTPGERKRTRRVLAVLIGSAVLALAVFLMAWQPWQRPLPPAENEHEHQVTPHGGTLASLGASEPHDHAEAVLEPGGHLTVYTLWQDATKPRTVERQLLTAWVRPTNQAKASRIQLVPMPLPGDEAGKTSRFKTTLPEALWGRTLSVTIPELIVTAGRYRVEFTEVASSLNATGHGLARRRLYTKPGGKYTQADIVANGGTPPAPELNDHEIAHVLAPRGKGWVCPVASAKSVPGYTWVLDGQEYRFCCLPCIDEFVRRAKASPDDIKRSEKYLKR